MRFILIYNKFYLSKLLHLQRAESALDRAKSDSVRDILAKHAMMASECFHMNNHVVDSSINAK